MKPIVIYHGNCADGFGAAWVFSRSGYSDAEFHPGVYQNAPPDVTGRGDLAHVQAVVGRKASARGTGAALSHGRSLNDAERAVKKAQNKLKRVERGVCPECNRTFNNLARHMACKHANSMKNATRQAGRTKTARE